MNKYIKNHTVVPLGPIARICDHPAIFNAISKPIKNTKNRNKKMQKETGGQREERNTVLKVDILSKIKNKNAWSRFPVFDRTVCLHFFLWVCKVCLQFSRGCWDGWR
jgi:hypothetical protein